MKIGFLAMSGVRVCDEELIRIGLTLPGFVERSETIASLPSLGLLTLAGMTPAPHERLYVESADVEDRFHDLATCDLVAISSLTAQSLEAYEISRRLRAAGTRTVMGGLHATILPDEVLQHCDAVVIGEGEVSWPDVLRDLERNQLQPRYGAVNAPFKLADAPMPAYDLLDLDRYNRITIQTSRGCPWQCEFCASSIMLTSKYKQKPIDRVLTEVDRICELWPRPFIELADDNSFVNKRYWRELLPQLAQRRIRWFTETDISVADDPDLLDLMREAGCAEVLIGLESPIPDGLPLLELKSDWKQRRADGAMAAVNRIQSRGVRVNGCFVVGLDGHTPDIFDAVYDFADRAALFDVQITLPTPFPGTPFYKRLKSQNRLTHDGQWNRCTLFDLNFIPDPMSPEELREGFLDLMRRLYSDEFTADRRARWKRAALANRRSRHRRAG
ncbi:MAG: radical SAM protein [Planctomycetota bacterium]|nr:radical SAM protein [Planctomycetota bacterium]